MKDQHDTNSGISRRKFITTLGLAAGASTILPALPVFRSGKLIKNKPLSTKNSFAGQGLLKIGVLLPPSHIYPAMSENFIAGMTIYLDQIGHQVCGRDIVLRKASVGFGPHSAVRQAQALIEAEKADMVTGIVDVAMNHELCRLFDNQGIFLIANLAGANIISRKDQSPFVICNSLDNWQANRTMGHWTAEYLGKKAFVAASFYESGYDALYAFNLGFENAGGQIVQTVINNLPDESKDRQPLLRAIEKARPDLVFASYSGEEAVDFIRAYQQAGLNTEIPLLGSGFMVDETVLREAGRAALGIKSCFPWSPSLDLSSNNNFYAAFKKKYNQPPDSFALLGFETAQLISSAVNHSEGELRDTRALDDGFFSSKIDSPRGLLVLNRETRHLTGPLYLREVRQHGTQLTNQVMQKFDQHNPPELLTVAADSGIKTGWLNPYLCA